MTYSIYSPLSGIIVSQVNNKNQIAGRPSVMGDYTPGEWYVKNRQVKPLPSNPVGQSQMQWQWDLASETWIYDATNTEASARKIRQNLFADVDKVNPMWYASMTAEQQAEVTAYRQAILDLTDQPGWPTEIVWPVKPAWL